MDSRGFFGRKPRLQIGGAIYNKSIYPASPSSKYYGYKKSIVGHCLKKSSFSGIEKQQRRVFTVTFSGKRA
jgi:hypothetical protein